MSRVSRRLSFGIVVALAGIIGLCFVWNGRVPVDQAKRSESPLESQNASTDHNYVGWKVCAECHSERVEEFQSTRHFQALRLPGEVDFPSGFSAGAAAFEPAGSSVRFEMSVHTGGATVTVASEASKPNDRTISPVEFVYGAKAGTDEVYFARHGEGLFELPIVWLDRKNCWGISLYNPYGKGDLARPLTPQCLECHNTWVDYRRGSLNEYGPLEPKLLGVTCERCHGPARSHVDYHRSNRLDKVAAQIVQPQKLSRDRQMDLCAQCHTNAVRYRRPPFSYRAGEPLEEYFHVLVMRNPEQDRVANQTRYLKESRCYQQSENLTCISCHDSHRKRPANETSRANHNCLKCHAADKCGAHSRLPDAVRDNCVGCHMPLRNKIQVNFETLDDVAVFPAPRYEHRIGIYPEVELEVMYQWYGTQAGESAHSQRVQLAQKLVDHWVDVADSARQGYRFLVAIDAYRTALRFGDVPQIRVALNDVQDRYKQSNVVWYEGVHLKQRGRLDEAILQFESLLKIHPNLAKAQYELGTLYAATGRPEDAVHCLISARDEDPNDPGPEAMLGWMDHLAGRSLASYEHYRRAAEIEPWSEKIAHMLGQCLAQLGRWNDAAEQFNRALEIDPNHGTTAHALRQILRERFSAAEALPWAVKAVETTKARQPELLLVLAETYRDLQRITEAETVTRAAVKVANEQQSAVLPQIRAFERSLIQLRSHQKK